MLTAITEQQHQSVSRTKSEAAKSVGESIDSGIQRPVVNSAAPINDGSLVRIALGAPHQSVGDVPGKLGAHLINHDVDRRIGRTQVTGWKAGACRKPRSKLPPINSRVPRQALGNPNSQYTRVLATDPLDTFLDLMVVESLDMVFVLTEINVDPAAVSKIVSSPYPVVGLSGGGAHVQFDSGASFSTRLLGYWVREQAAARGFVSVFIVMSVAASRRRLRSRSLRDGGGEITR